MTIETASTNHAAPPFDGAVRLEHWGVIRARGEEAASFLHAQLSQDINSLTAHQARLAAYCSAKGRMLASFAVLCPQAGEYWLAGSADVLPATLKRLSMFVLRAKARLDDASAEIALVGLVGAAAQRLLDGATLPEAWSGMACQGGMLVRLPASRADDDTLVARYLWAGPTAQAAAIVADSPTLPLAAWQWLEVNSGVAMIVERTAEQFVPQMVNFELVGGVNFKKGCYPGQEVVARSQYLGKLKRRAVLVRSDHPLAAGQEVFAAEDPTQPCGMVVNAAPHPAGGYSALVETKLAALAGAGLRAGSADGPVLQPSIELPYPLPDGDASGSQPA